MNTTDAFIYIYACVIVVLIVVLVAVAVRRRHETQEPQQIVHVDLEDMTDWYPPEIEPIHVGIYQVSMPWKSVTSIQKAHWDGSCWRDVNNGFECYFQRLSWRGVQLQAALRM